jgi:hypothetical protein
MTRSPNAGAVGLDGPPATEAAPAGESEPRALAMAPERPVPTGRRWPSLVAAGTVYLVLAVLLFWNVWSTHPTSTTTCGCGDASLFTWFLEWPAYALAHGHNPFFSTAMFHPVGINLPANTSELGIGIPLAPVTWAFGPVATLNVALTLSPFLSALSMFVLVRRWVRWSPAAFVAGLLYGFSPFVLTNLMYAHLMDSMLFVAPLVVLCLDELLVRQRRRPLLVGAALGLLVVLQFFLGTEMLVIMAMGTAIGLVVVFAHAVLRHREQLAGRARYALTGLGAGAAVGAALLAYPVWYSLDGPSNFGSLVWPQLGQALQGTLPSHYVEQPPVTPRLLELTHALFGYQGAPITSDSFVGVGILVVIAVGLVLWRRDLRMWLFASVGLVCVGLSLYIGKHAPVYALWRFFHPLPLLRNVIQARFAALVLLCTAVLLGLIVDHAHQAVRQAIGERSDHRPAWVRWAPAAVAGLVGLVALIPIQLAVSRVEPMAAVPVAVPDWFTGPGSRLRPDQVVLVYPAPFGGIQVAMTWQAMDRMAFSMTGGGGPQGIPQRAGAERAGFEVLSSATFLLGQYPQASADAAVTAVRKALAGWGTTTIVVPNQSGRPQYDRGYHTAYALGLFTAATGRPPRYVDRAWVWSGVRTPDPQRLMATGAFQACVDRGGAASQRAGLVPPCVMHGSV